jgi:small subunit ribosomal protein S16
MPTVIRMKRGGRTHSPYYRVVVMDSRDRSRGRVIDEIGVYHPCGKPEPKIEIDAEKALEWLKRGARPSDTARSVLSRNGVMARYAECASDAAPAVVAEVAVEAAPAVVAEVAVEAEQPAAE